jgi:hypothetical protein
MLPPTRNDNPRPVIAGKPIVIASERQIVERAARHCEQSEAIQCECLLRLDCFTNGNYVAAGSQ